MIASVKGAGAFPSPDEVSGRREPGLDDVGPPQSRPGVTCVELETRTVLDFTALARISVVSSIARTHFCTSIPHVCVVLCVMVVQWIMLM